MFAISERNQAQLQIGTIRLVFGTRFKHTLNKTVDGEFRMDKTQSSSIQKTRRFYAELQKRSQEAKEHSENLTPIEDFLKRHPITEPTNENNNHEKRPPKHCPNCGSTNIHNQELESRHPISELYDTYCRKRQWSGDISPDIPLGKATHTSELTQKPLTKHPNKTTHH
jgi:hypothetical protein